MAQIGDTSNSQPATPTQPTVEDRFEPIILPSERKTASFSSARRSRSSRQDAPDPRPVYWTAFIAALVFALAPILYLLAYRQGLKPLTDPTVLTVMIVIFAAAPVLLAVLAAFLVQQGRRLTAESRRLHRLAEDMLGPAAIAAAEAGGAVEALQRQIAAAESAAQAAGRSLVDLQETLGAQTAELNEATAGSIASASDLAAQMGQQRGEMQSLSQDLQSQAAGVGEAINRQARMVAEASELAETQLREAETALAARAADLAAAAGEAAAGAKTVGEALDHQVARLDGLGQGMEGQLRQVQEGLAAQHAGLEKAAIDLRGEHEEFARQAELRAAQLAEFLVQARMNTAEIGDNAARASQVLGELIDATREQMSQLVTAASSQRGDLAAELEARLAQVGDLLDDNRTRLQAEFAQINADVEQAFEQRIVVAQQQVEIAFNQMHQLVGAAQNERAGASAEIEAELGRVSGLLDANRARLQAEFAELNIAVEQAFEQRIVGAREQIETSALTIEQAGAASIQRLEHGLSESRESLSGLQNMLDALDERVSRMPQEAKGRSAQVRQAVEQGMDELLDKARKTAQEAQAIDSAFQERVKRNYDMLSETVKLMGAMTEPARAAAMTPPTDLGPPPAAAPPPELPLRGRLRLTPAQVAVPPAPPPLERQAAPAPEPEPSRPPRPSAPRADGDLGAEMAVQLRGMGIDPPTLLAKSKVEELAVIVWRGDRPAARANVSKLAPAAVRRLVRRLFSDGPFKAQTDGFLDAFAATAAAASKDGGVVTVASLLTTDGGRAYLLLDAAVGELP